MLETGLEMLTHAPPRLLFMLAIPIVLITLFLILDTDGAMDMLGEFFSSIFSLAFLIFLGFLLVRIVRWAFYIE